ncbi:polyprenyl synthetase family protein [Bacillus sp. FJAT-27445]|uniref:polyprenyl synthetase family protein n=1 Tax=Bacillus sp. FJAT-27445 TaxID=1679166 RepID=UPI0007443B46|nr:polyprenyl synthetase family protein [Bacillus sp. FJAT-27445]
MTVKVPERIFDSMVGLIRKSVLQEDLQEKIIAYVEYKAIKGFPFAELAILHYSMMNGAKTKEILAICAAVELLVLAGDILDDLEDGDAAGNPWLLDKAVGLNASTAILMLAINLLNQSNHPFKEEAAGIFIEYTLLACNGQHMDLTNQLPDESECLNAILLKSGSLAALACLVGSALAIGSPPEPIARYSRYIGLIGQLNNDLQDLWGRNNKSDLLGRKYTLPTLYLLKGKSEASALIRKYYSWEVGQDELVRNNEKISAAILESGVHTYIGVMKKIYQNKVKHELKHLGVSHQYIDQLIQYTL